MEWSQVTCQSRGITWKSRSKLVPYQTKYCVNIWPCHQKFTLNLVVFGVSLSKISEKCPLKANLTFFQKASLHADCNFAGLKKAEWHLHSKKLGKCSNPLWHCQNSRKLDPAPVDVYTLNSRLILLFQQYNILISNVERIEVEYWNKVSLRIGW